MRSLSLIRLGLASSLGLAALAPTPLFAQSTPSQPSPAPLRKPTDPPVVPSADPARPTNPSLDPAVDPAAPATTPATTPGMQPDPNAPGAPTSPPVSDPSAVPPVADPTAATTSTSPTAGALVVADQGYDDDNQLSYAWSDRRMQSGIGIATILGGGVTGFTDKTMRNTTSDVGGLWDLRVTIGSHIPLALDVSYIGTASNLRGLPTGKSGTLLGTTVEGALRYNILPHAPVNPYIFGGVGWQRYDVTETNVTLSDSGMNDKDNLLEFPMGAGIQYRMGGFVGDIRGTFRATTDQNLVLKNASVNPTSGDFAEMHTWEASAAVGYEF
jgi:hypothetical protein